jgi:Protein of unknown function (DUF3108)
MFRCAQPILPLLALLAVWSGAALAAQPGSIFLRYEVTGGPGLHFLTLQVNVDQSPERYSLAVDAETRGIADLFVDLRSRLEARGRIVGDRLLPEAMRAETHRRGVDFHTRVDYGADGSVTAEATPAPTRPVTPVSPAQMRGTVDQLTAYLLTARRLAARGSCALALPDACRPAKQPLALLMRSTRHAQGAAASGKPGSPRGGQTTPRTADR